MKTDILKHLPHWMILLFAGAILVLIGSASVFTVGKNAVQVAYPYKIPVIAVGVLLIGVALFRSRGNGGDSGPKVTRVEVLSIDVDRTNNTFRTRVSGRIEPVAPGVRVWIAREHQAYSTGQLHLASKPALTDKNGNWEQVTYLWRGGVFRIHAVVGGAAAEALFTYYRRAYDHARSIYQKKVDRKAEDFPGWPFLEELPPGCVSDFRSVSV